MTAKKFGPGSSQKSSAHATQELLTGGKTIANLTAPPWMLTLSESMAERRMLARTTTLKASLISHRSTSDAWHAANIKQGSLLQGSLCNTGLQV